LVAKHALFKCAQFNRVHIDTVSITVPPPEERGVVGKKEEGGEGEVKEDDDLKKA
jgi:hypothetical protein